MSKRIWTLLVFFVGGCAETHVLTLRNPHDLISPSEEIRIGADVEARLRGEVRPLDDSALQTYVAALGTRVAAPSQNARALPVRFVVVDAPNTVNVFALPGGTIYVCSGLLRAVRNESELAGLLAHEVGHVTERDVAQRLADEYGSQAVIAAALGESPSLAIQLAHHVEQSGFLLDYSAAEERQADRDAVAALADARISADGLSTLFRRLAAVEKRASTADFLRTHPAPLDRAREVDHFASTMDAHRGAHDSPAFAQARGELRRLYAGRSAPVL